MRTLFAKGRRALRGGEKPRELRDAVPCAPASVPAFSVVNDSAASDPDADGVLSAPGGALELSPMEARYCAIVRENGKLRVLVQEHYLTNLDLMAALDRVARTARISLPPAEAATPEVIRGYYQQTATAAEPLTADHMRGRVLDNIARAAKARASDIDTALEGDETCVTLLLRGFKTPPIDRFHRADTDAYIATVFNMGEHGDNVEISDLDQSWSITNPAILSLLPGGVHTIRCQTIKLANGRFLNMRLQYEGLRSNETGIAALRLPEEIEQRLLALLFVTSGCFTICGPTESGKTTTQMNFLIDMVNVNQGSVKVMSVSDPPEGFYPGIYQASSDATVDQRGFSTAARLVAAFLRTSPHYINFGEVRDEVMAGWLFTALTMGKPLLATTHTHDGLDVPGRYAELGIPAAKAYDPAKHSAIMAQRLVPHLCPDCRVPFVKAVEAQPALRGTFRVWRNALGDRVEQLYARGLGCPKCLEGGIIGQPGLVGRQIYAELVEPSKDDRLFRVLRGDKVKARQHWLGEQGAKSHRLYALDDLLEGRIGATVFEQFFQDPMRLRWDWERHDETRQRLGDVGGDFSG
jgi:general secretion pathway protein E